MNQWFAVDFFDHKKHLCLNIEYMKSQFVTSREVEKLLIMIQVINFIPSNSMGGKIELDEKRGVNEIWHKLLSIQSRQQTGRLSAISQTEIRPSTAYMCSLMPAEPTAEVLPPTSEPSEQAAQDEHKSSHTT